MRELWNKLYHSRFNPEINLEAVLGKESGLVKKFYRREGLERFTDNLQRNAYSIYIGAFLNSQAGQTPISIALSRGLSAIVNHFTGEKYSQWVDFVYRKTKTTKESSTLRKKAADLGAFFPFEGTVFVATAIPGLLLDQWANGEIQYLNDIVHSFKDFGPNLKEGVKSFVALSPVIAPTMNYWMYMGRDFFGLKRPDKKASDALNTG